MALGPSIEQFRQLSQPNPGRMVLVGLSPSGEEWIQIVAMGGRSAASRNRQYVHLSDDRIGTVPLNELVPSGNPKLTIYTAMKSRNGIHVAGDGDHVNKIASILYYANPLENTLRMIENGGRETDYSSRIFAAVDCDEGKSAVYDPVIGRITRMNLDPNRSKRVVTTFDFDPGEAAFLTTYRGDGTTTPFESDPIEVKLPATLKASVDLVKASLDQTYVAIAAKSINRQTGRIREIIDRVNNS